MSDYVEVELQTIMGGAAGERFRDALNEILENCVDLNTEVKTAREITLKFKFIPQAEDRGKIACLMECKTRMAPPISVATFMWAGKESGSLKAYEQDIQQGKFPFDDEEKKRPTIVSMEGGR